MFNESVLIMFAELIDFVTSETVELSCVGPNKEGGGARSGQAWLPLIIDRGMPCAHESGLDNHKDTKAQRTEESGGPEDEKMRR